jgi:hypothetical protein
VARYKNLGQENMERCGPSLGNLAWSKLIHTMFPDSEARSRAPKRSGISWWKDPVIIALLKQTTDGERTLNSLELEVNRKLSGDVIVFFVRQETKGVNNLTVVRPRTNTKFPPPWWQPHEISTPQPRQWTVATWEWPLELSPHRRALLRWWPPS